MTRCRAALSCRGRRPTAAGTTRAGRRTTRTAGGMAMAGRMTTARPGEMVRMGRQLRKRRGYAPQSAEPSVRSEDLAEAQDVPDAGLDLETAGQPGTPDAGGIVGDGDQVIAFR